MRRPLLDDEWDQLSERDKFSLFDRVQKVVPQTKKQIKTVRLPFCGNLTVFNGKLRFTGEPTSLWQYLGFTDLETNLNDRAVEVMFHKDSHAVLEKLLLYPGLNAKLRLFHQSAIPIIMHAQSSEISSFSHGDGMALRLMPGTLATWVIIWWASFKKNLKRKA